MTALPDAVLFDMDGTIVDSEPLWLAAELAVMAELGGPWTPADQEACLGGPLERVVDLMLERSGSDAGADAVRDRVLDVVEGFMREAELAWRPGARALLTECRALGIPAALVTASWRRLVDAMHEGIAADLGYEPFAVIVAGDDVTASKPHPEPYATAARLLGTEPGRCLALEDSPTGIRSAWDAGCAVIAIPHLAPVPAGISPCELATLEGSTVAGLWAATRR